MTALRTVRRWSFVAAAGLVVALAVAYVARGVVLQQQVSRAVDQAARDVRDGLPAAERAAQGDLAVVVEAAGGAAPAFVWRELVCDVDNQDAGLFLVDHYVQRCVIHSVALIETEAVTRGAGYCDGPYADPTTPTMAAGGSQITAVRAARATDCADVTLPMAWQVESRIVRPLEGSAPRPARLASSPAWLVAVADTSVSSTELGCSPWKLPFCWAPVDSPSL